MNFYLSLLDKQEKAPDENPSIGIFRFGHPKLQTCQDWPNMAGPFLQLNRDTLFETVSAINILGYFPLFFFASATDVESINCIPVIDPSSDRRSCESS